MLWHVPDSAERLGVSQRLAERPVHGARRCLLAPANQNQRQQDEHGGSWTEEGDECGELHRSGRWIYLNPFSLRRSVFTCNNRNRLLNMTNSNNVIIRLWDESSLCVSSPVSGCCCEDVSLPRLFIQINPPPPLQKYRTGYHPKNPNTHTHTQVSAELVQSVFTVIYTKRKLTQGVRVWRH